MPSAMAPAAPAAPKLTQAPSASPPLAPGERETAMPAPEVSAPPDVPTLGEKLRRDWETIKWQARRGGDEWREGWDQLRRVFGY